jgi:hypothetical protein
MRKLFIGSKSSGNDPWLHDSLCCCQHGLYFCSHGGFGPNAGLFALDVFNCNESICGISRSAICHNQSYVFWDGYSND